MDTTPSVLSMTPRPREEDGAISIFRPGPARVCQERASLIHDGVILINHARAEEENPDAWHGVSSASYAISGPYDYMRCEVETDTSIPIYLRVFAHTERGRRKERLRQVSVLVSNYTQKRQLRISLPPNTVRVAFSIRPMEPSQQEKTDGAHVTISNVELLPRSVY